MRLGYSSELPKAGELAPSIMTEPAAVSEAERARAFWRRVERYAPGMQVSGDGNSDTRRQLLVVSGWACELRILPDGRRQIFSFLLPGDIIETGTNSLASRGIMALTRLEVVSPMDVVSQQAKQDAARDRELRLLDHITRIGRLSARERVIHLLVELRDRLSRAGQLDGDSFRVPLTQEIFADSLGLSIVHINRTLKELRKNGWVTVKLGVVTLHNLPKLIAACNYERADSDFDPEWRSTRSA